jgi:DNA-binding transcriptional LysR family regulator
MSTIRFLRTFLAVAHSGSFVEASGRVALTQAAVGLQMRALENELKTALFERSGRGVVLSEAGRALIAHAEKIIVCYDEMRAGLNDESDIAGTVTVGCIVSAMGLLSRTMLQLKPLYPKLNVRLVMQESSGLAQNVKNGNVDAAIFVEDSQQELRGLLWTPLYVEPLAMIASSQVAGPGSSIKALLREQPFLRFDRRTVSGVRIEQTLRKLGQVPQDLLELSAVSAIVELVRQNVGVTIVPLQKGADWENDSSLCVLRLPGRPVTRQIGILEQVGREHITSIIRRQLIAVLAEKSN